MWPVILWRRKFGDVEIELDLDIISEDKGGGVILSGGEGELSGCFAELERPMRTCGLMAV